MQTQLVTRVTAKTGTIDNANLTAQKRHRDDAHQHGGLRAMAIDATSGLNVTWNKSIGSLDASDNLSRSTKDLQHPGHPRRFCEPPRSMAPQVPDLTAD